MLGGIDDTDLEFIMKSLFEGGDMMNVDINNFRGFLDESIGLRKFIVMLGCSFYLKCIVFFSHRFQVDLHYSHDLI